MVPLLVRRIGFEKLQIISGHRRKSALNAIGEKYAECDVVDMTDDQAYKALMVTNIQAKSLSEIEEAEGIKHMIDLYSWTQGRVATEFGKSQVWVNRRLDLLKLNTNIQDKIITRVITATHGRELGQLPQEQQEEAITHVIEQKLSTRETAELVRDINTFEEAKDEVVKHEVVEEMKVGLPVQASDKVELPVRPLEREPRNLTGTYQERKEAADVLLKIRLAIVDMSNPYYPDKLVELNLDGEAIDLMDRLENSMKWLRQKITNARSRTDGTATNGTVLEFKSKTS